jgi:hypothetical protein
MSMLPSLAIPKLARPSTPPRSPHTELPASHGFPFLNSLTPNQPQPDLAQGSAAQAAMVAPFHLGPTNPYSPALRGRSSKNIRPTRRDVLLCSLTLVVAWFLFHTASSGEDTSFSSSRDYHSKFREGASYKDTGAYSGADESARTGYLSKHLGKLGSIVPGLGGWLGSRGTTQGHGQGDFGIETICEVGSGGTVKVHGYSDSVAKVSHWLPIARLCMQPHHTRAQLSSPSRHPQHPIITAQVDTVDADGDLFDESDAPGLTRLGAHQPGWTIFENLYLSGGTFWVVTSVVLTITRIFSTPRPSSALMLLPTSN